MAQEAIGAATALLRAGDVIAFPTETFFGLAALPDNQSAVDKLCACKSRGLEQGIPLIIDEAMRLDTWLLPEADAVRKAREVLQKHFWPGPLSLIVAADFAATGFAEAIFGPAHSLAVRISPHPISRSLAKAAGGVITATSANPHGLVPPSLASEVTSYFPNMFVLPGASGAAEASADVPSLPSTLLDVRAFPFTILREGAISKQDLADWVS